MVGLLFSPIQPLLQISYIFKNEGIMVQLITDHIYIDAIIVIANK
jgi:hypothetical protein